MTRIFKMPTKQYPSDRRDSTIRNVAILTPPYDGKVTISVSWAGVRTTGPTRTAQLRIYLNGDNDPNNPNTSYGDDSFSTAYNCSRTVHIDVKAGKTLLVRTNRWNEGAMEQSFTIDVTYAWEESLGPMPPVTSGTCVAFAAPVTSTPVSASIGNARGTRHETTLIAPCNGYFVMNNSCFGSKEDPRPEAHVHTYYNGVLIHWDKDEDFDDYNFSWSDRLEVVAGTSIALKTEFMNEWARSHEFSTYAGFEPK